LNAANPVLPHIPGKHRHARRTRPVIGTDAAGAVRIHANNVAEAAKLAGVSRSAVWFALHHPWKAAGLTWVYATRFPRHPSRPRRRPVQRVTYLPEQTPATPVVVDGDTPTAFERGRFDKARQYNPALTWEGWITVAGKKRGRPPRRDSGAAKGVARG
jgi:hypothetical protein